MARIKYKMLGMAQFRADHGLTQEELAKKARLSIRSITHAENGNPVGAATATCISRALGKKLIDVTERIVE